MNDEMFNQYKDQPHGELLMGRYTNLCMNIICKCGSDLQVDTDFCRYIHCPICDVYYAVSTYIELVPLSQSQIEEISHAPSLIHTPSYRPDVPMVWTSRPAR